MLILIPLMGVGYAFIGPLFGIRKEVVENGSTSAENAFTWLRKKAGQYALVGIGMFLIIGAPIIIQWLIVTLVYGPMPNQIIQNASSVISIVYTFIAYGFVANWLPAVTDGQNVSQGLTTSIAHLRENPRRVYGVLLGFAALVGIVILPAFITVLLYGPTGFLLIPINPIIVPVLTYSAIAAIVMVFVGIPAHLIIMTRVYMMLSGRSLSDSDKFSEPEISLIGG